MAQRHDPEGKRLPIKVDTTTNGEFSPRPLTAAERFANSEASISASEIARRLGVGRRNFLTSFAGAAATLLAFNRAHAAAGAKGGSYVLPVEAGHDNAAAEAALVSDDFVFDIQGHHVSPIAQWRSPKSPWVEFLREVPRVLSEPADKRSAFQHLEIIGRDNFIKEIFLDSDTDKAVLTFVPTAENEMPLSTEEAAVTRAVASQLDGTDRLLIHGRVIPNLDGDVDRMPDLANRWKIAAWKTYTQFGAGWWLDDERIGDPFFAKARETGNRLLCIHKGLPLAPMGLENHRFSRCDDVGRAAARHPDFQLVIYHAGFDPEVEEGPFVRGSGKGGIDSLIQSMLDAGIAPNANVHAELGSTWRFLMGKPEQAAHAIGKLLKYVGEDNVLWGTDSIWYGSPQDQIQAFRTFQISEEFQDRYGYPALTPAIRSKIFGLSSAKLYGVDVDRFRAGAKQDAIARRRAEYRQAPDPSFLTYGPKTRKEFLAFLGSGS